MLSQIFTPEFSNHDGEFPVGVVRVVILLAPLPFHVLSGATFFSVATEFLNLVHHVRLPTTCQSSGYLMPLHSILCYKQCKNFRSEKQNAILTLRILNFFDISTKQFSDINVSFVLEKLNFEEMVYCQKNHITLVSRVTMLNLNHNFDTEMISFSSLHQNTQK